MFYFAPLINQYISGVCASGLHEAKLGREEFGKEVHTYGAGYCSQDMEEILRLSDYVVFNSFYQLHRFRDLIHKHKTKNLNLQIGVRINPL